MRPVFPKSSTTDILGFKIFVVGACPMHSRMFSPRCSVPTRASGSSPPRSSHANTKWPLWPHPQLRIFSWANGVVKNLRVAFGAVPLSPLVCPPALQEHDTLVWCLNSKWPCFSSVLQITWSPNPPRLFGIYDVSQAVLNTEDAKSFPRHSLWLRLRAWNFFSSFSFTHARHFFSEFCSNFCIIHLSP